MLLRLALIFCFIASNRAIDVHCQVEELYGHLFDGYAANTRPVKGAGSGALDVFLEYSLLELISLSEVEQKMTTLSLVTLTWKDEFLQWSVDECNFSLIIPSYYDIWNPDVAIGNGNHFIFDMDSDDSSYRLTVTHLGLVTFNVISQLETQCTMDVMRFPFDSQTCLIQFVVWAYAADKVTLASKNNSLTIDDLKASDQWDLSNAEVWQCLSRSIVPDLKHERHSQVTYVFRFDRNPTYHAANLIYPCVVTSLVTLMTFVLTSESSAKISVGITVILSFQFFLVSIDSILPRISDRIPYIVIYVNMILFLSSLSLLSTIVVLIMHHRDHSSTPPRWLNWIYTTLTWITSRAWKRRRRRKAKLQSLPEKGPENKHVSKREQVLEMLLKLKGTTGVAPSTAATTAAVAASGGGGDKSAGDPPVVGVQVERGLRAMNARRGRGSKRLHDTVATTTTTTTSKENSTEENKTRRRGTGRGAGRTGRGAGTGTGTVTTSTGSGRHASAEEIKEILMGIDRMENDPELHDLTWSKMTDAFNKFLLFCFVTATVFGAVLLLHVFPRVVHSVGSQMPQLESCRQIADSVENRSD